MYEALHSSALSSLGLSSSQRKRPSGMLACFLYSAVSFAVLKSFCVTFIRRSLSANNPASVQI